MSYKRWSKPLKEYNDPKINAESNAQDEEAVDYE